jgi:hypothetical protein
MLEDIGAQVESFRVARSIHDKAFDTVKDGRGLGGSSLGGAILVFVVQSSLPAEPFGLLGSAEGDIVFNYIEVKPNVGDGRIAVGA